MMLLRALPLFAALLCLGGACKGTPDVYWCPLPGGGGDAPATASAPHRLAFSGGQDPFQYATGTSGTYTVPTGWYVVSVSAHCTTAGSVAIAWNGTGVLNGDAGAAIAIPAGQSYNLAKPVLVGAPYELGPGSVFTFTGTDSYVVVLQKVES